MSTTDVQRASLADYVPGTDGAHIGFLSDAEVDLGKSSMFVGFELRVDQYLVNRAADNCSCPNGKIAFLFHGHCQCAGDTLNYTGPGVRKS